jgi:hypothetical protein
VSHAPVETLAELLELDVEEIVAGHLSAKRGDPEPGGNRSRAFHHGWRTRMMDLGEIEVPGAHRRLVRDYLAHRREQSRNE